MASPDLRAQREAVVDAVRAYFAESRRAFPDQRNELIALHHADDVVIVEFDLLGTHLGPLRALPPNGHPGLRHARSAGSWQAMFAQKPRLSNAASRRGSCS